MEFGKLYYSTVWQKQYTINGNFQACVPPIYCTGTGKLQSCYDNCDSMY